jgi:predicted transcriptional regulator
MANLAAKVEAAPARKRGRPAKPPVPETQTVPAITARQVRAARALLGIGQVEAAALAGIARPVYTRIENGTVRGRPDTLDKIEAAFRKAGVEILYADDVKGEGARMAKPDAGL